MTTSNKQYILTLVLALLASALGACTPWQTRMDPYTGAPPRTGTVAERDAFFRQLALSRHGKIRGTSKTEDGQRVTVSGQVYIRKNDDEPVCYKNEYLFKQDGTSQTLQAVVMTVEDPRSYEFQELGPKSRTSSDEEAVGHCGGDALVQMWLEGVKMPENQVLYGYVNNSVGLSKLVVTDDLAWFMAHEKCESLEEANARLAKLREAGDYAAWKYAYDNLVLNNKFVFRGVSRENSTMTHVVDEQKELAAKKAAKETAEKQAAEAERVRLAEIAAEAAADAAFKAPALDTALPVYAERASASQRRGKLTEKDVARRKVMEDLLQKAIIGAADEDRLATAGAFTAMLAVVQRKVLPEQTAAEASFRDLGSTVTDIGRKAASKLTVAVVPIIDGRLDSSSSSTGPRANDALYASWPLYTILGLKVENNSSHIDETHQVVLALTVVEPVKGALTPALRQSEETRRIGNATEDNPAYAKWKERLAELQREVEQRGGTVDRMAGQGGNARYVETNTYTQGSFVKTETHETQASLQNRSNAAFGRMAAASALRDAERDLEAHVANEPEKKHLVGPNTNGSLYEPFTISIQQWRGTLHRAVVLQGGGIERRVAQDYTLEWWSDRKVSGSPSHPAEGSFRTESQVRKDVHQHMDDDMQKLLQQEQIKLITERLTAREKALPKTLSGSKRAQEVAWSRYLFQVGTAADAAIVPVKPEDLLAAQGD